VSAGIDEHRAREWAGVWAGREVEVTRVVHRLTAIAVTNAKTKGFYPDGGGLYLRVTSTGSKS
jgi:hypothetical protein